MTNNLLFIMTLSFSSRHSFQINVGDVLPSHPHHCLYLFIHRHYRCEGKGDYKDYSILSYQNLFVYLQHK